MMFVLILNPSLPNCHSGALVCPSEAEGNMSVVSFIWPPWLKMLLLAKFHGSQFLVVYSVVLWRKVLETMLHILLMPLPGIHPASNALLRP